MLTRFTCLKGHEWEALEATAGAAEPACPVCAMLSDTSAVPATLSLPTDPAAARPAPAAPVLMQVPGYEILSELGRGGMGVVYLARQAGLNRLCALKMILSGVYAGAVELRRFRAEAEVIARLSHPGIVGVYEVGECQGLPYFSLEYCSGGGLEKRLKGVPLQPTEAAALVERLARAVQVAHDAGVIHRDLKPANVLLASGGREPPVAGAGQGAPTPRSPLEGVIPKVSDFGLAKRLGDTSQQTNTGNVMGTPSYMAPEQACDSKDVGPAVDVYALGAILYECLTGCPPFRGPTALETIAQVICQEPLPPARLQPRVPRDLETIALKCLEKTPQRRYASAAALADDLRRFLDGEPIVARPVGPLARAVKWARRRPAVAALGALLVAVTLTGVGLVLWQWQRAEALAVTEGRAKETALSALQDAEQARRQEREHRQAAEGARDDAEKQLYLSNIALAHREWQADNASRARELLNGCPVRRRGWEYHYLKGVQSRSLLRLLPHGPARVCSVAFSPCGKFLASAGLMDKAVISDARTGEPILALGGGKHPVLALAYSGDGKVLATAGQDGSVRLWDARTGEPGAVLRGHRGRVNCVAISRDGRLASGGQDGLVQFWDLASGKLCQTGKGHTGAVTCLAFSRDGKLLASGSRNPDTTVRVWEGPTGRSLYALPRFNVVVTGVAFSPDGKRLLVTDGVRRRLVTYEAGTGKLQLWHTFQASRSVAGLAVAPDSRRVALACHAGHLHVYDLQSAKNTVYRGHAGWVVSVAYSPDGSRLACGTMTGEVRVWDAEAGPEATVRTIKGYVNRLAFSPDDSLMALGLTTPLGVDLKATAPGRVQLSEPATGQVVRTLSGPHANVTSLAFSPDGTRLAALWLDRSISLWEVSTGRLLHRLQGAGSGLKSGRAARARVVFSRDGKEVLMGADVLQAWDAHTGRPLRRPPLAGLAAAPWEVAFSPGAQYFVTATLLGTVQFWDPATGKEVRRINGPFVPSVLAFDRGGSRLAIASSRPGSSRLLVYDLPSGQEVRSFAGHSDLIHWLDFSPDGTRLVSGAADNAVKLWDLASGQELLSLEGHDAGVNAGGFSPDGVTLASADGASTLRLWSGARRREVFTWASPGQVCLALAWAPDGRQLAYSGGASQAVLRKLPSGRQLFNVGRSEIMQVGSSLAFSPDGKELAIGLGDKNTGEIEVWDLATQKRRWHVKGHTGPPMALAYSPDGRRLVSASHDRTAAVWDVQTGRLVVRFPGHPKRVNGAAFSPDGRWVATCGREGTVRVWDPETGKERLVLQGPHGSPGNQLLAPDPWSVVLSLRANVVSLGSVAYSPDGKYLAACGLGRMPGQRVVLIWDAQTGREVRALRGHTGDVYQVAYRPDGKVLASVGDDRVVRLWDAGTGRELLALSGHDATIYRVAFSPDGKQVVSTGSDATVRLWDVADVGPAE